MPKRDKPPTFRGSDFVMRYAQGQWSEERIIESINDSDDYRAIPYGRSQVGPSNIAEIPAYWEKYRQAESVGKRPDILVFKREDFERLQQHLPADPTLAKDEELVLFLENAICAIEAENSLWVAAKMPDYGKKPTKLDFIAPTVIVKEEDASELKAWQDFYKVPICIVQVFFDRGYIVTFDKVLSAVTRVKATMQGEGVADLGLGELNRKEALKQARALQKELGVFLKEQKFADARTGSATTKMTYRVHHTKTVEFGELDPETKPQPISKVMEEANGKIMAYVHFVGGKLKLSSSVKAFFESL